LTSLRDLDKEFVRTLADRDAAAIVEKRLKVYENTLASQGENPVCTPPPNPSTTEGG